MSFQSIILGNTTSIKEILVDALRGHRHELIVGAIMTAISVAIAVSATGDLSQAFAAHRGR